MSQMWTWLLSQPGLEMSPTPANTSTCGLGEAVCSATALLLLLELCRRKHETFVALNR